MNMPWQAMANQEFEENKTTKTAEMQAFTQLGDQLRTALSDLSQRQPQQNIAPLLEELIALQKSSNSTQSRILQVSVS